MKYIIRFNLSRHLASIALLSAVVLQSPFARASDVASYSYICSDNSVYTVKVKSSRPDGFTSRGPWHEFQSFCKASISSNHDCTHDNSPQTSKCFFEFKEKGNLRLVNDTLAVWPDKIRHTPPSSWFTQIQLTSAQLKEVCLPALKALNCVKPFSVSAQNEQLKCLYDRSSFANRATGRNCFQAISTKLDAVAQVQRRQILSSQRSLAGR